MTYSRSNIAGIVALVLRVVLGGVFVYAGYLKLRDPWALFAMSIASYEILPMPAVEFVAKTLPWFEVVLGLVLIAGVFRRIATVSAAALLLVFFGLILRAYFKGMEINCGCFGPGEAISWKSKLRVGSMVFGALYVAVMSFVQRRKPAPAGEAIPEPAYRA
jgi:putative oxidoreductase